MGELVAQLLPEDCHQRGCPGAVVEEGFCSTAAVGARGLEVLPFEWMPVALRCSHHKRHLP